jgi:Protein of unknown function (DUF3703)
MTTSGDIVPLREAAQLELRYARRARIAGDSARAFAHLERAHILGQRLTSLHVRTHVAMLSVGWSRRDFREVVGQIPRIVAAALFSRIWVPPGNTGGANVPAMRPMPIPADLRAILDRKNDQG